MDTLECPLLMVLSGMVMLLGRWFSVSFAYACKYKLLNHSRKSIAIPFLILMKWTMVKKAMAIVLMLVRKTTQDDVLLTYIFRFPVDWC